jgi:ectoine hydroxylase-related dioxygenase (phytanoyl-CoA dioxygenase family)
VRRGDAILFHDGMLHSGTANVSGQDRCFFGVTFNMTWMRQEDNFAGPNCQRLIQEAEDTQDYRLLRLLGVDRKQHRRLNSGLVLPSKGAWARWAEEDSGGRSIEPNVATT